MPTAAVIPLPIKEENNGQLSMQVEFMELGNDLQSDWYIIEPCTSMPEIFTTFCAPTRSEVIEQFLATKLASITIASPSLQAHAHALRHNEELVKQLMVQPQHGPKRLMCPNDNCDEIMLEQDQHVKDQEGSLAQLFARMALHDLTKHQEQNPIYRQAEHLAAPSFDQAHSNLLALNENAP